MVASPNTWVMSSSFESDSRPHRDDTRFARSLQCSLTSPIAERIEPNRRLRCGASRCVGLAEGVAEVGHEQVLPADGVDRCDPPVGQEQGPLERWNGGVDGAQLQLDERVDVEGVGDAGDVAGPFHHRHRFVDMAASDGRLPQEGGDVGTPGDRHRDGAQIAQGSVDLLGGIETGQGLRQVAGPPEGVSALAECVAEAEGVAQGGEPGDGIIEQCEREIGPTAEPLGECGGHGQVPARLGGAHDPAQEHGLLGDGARHGSAIVDDRAHGQAW